MRLEHKTTADALSSKATDMTRANAPGRKRPHALARLTWTSQVNMQHGKTRLRLSLPCYSTSLLRHTLGCLAHPVRPRERAKVWSETVEVESKKLQ